MWTTCEAKISHCHVDWNGSQWLISMCHMLLIKFAETENACRRLKCQIFSLQHFCFTIFVTSRERWHMQRRRRKIHRFENMMWAGCTKQTHFQSIFSRFKLICKFRWGMPRQWISDLVVSHLCACFIAYVWAWALIACFRRRFSYRLSNGIGRIFLSNFLWLFIWTYVTLFWHGLKSLGQIVVHAIWSCLWK